MSGIGIILTIVFCFAVFSLPRCYAALAFVGAALYITQGQLAEIGGISFTAIRFVEVSAAIRVFAKREIFSIRMTPPDRWFLIFFITYVVTFHIRAGKLDTYNVGIAVDGCLVYFTFRALIQTKEDFILFIQRVAILLIPFSLLMIKESISGKNIFSLMGDVPEVPVWRNGYYRCQGSFRHAITAGTVGATFLSIFFGLILQKKSFLIALLGVAACIIIVITSHSSGPLLAAIVACASWGCWVYREHMKWVRRGIVAAVIGLNLMMTAPVWYIFDRISGVIGGDGWHRSNLIDKFIRNISEWWLFGMPIEKTSDWAATVTKYGSVDVTNYYISTGLGGGLVSIIFLICMFVAFFRYVGLGLKYFREQVPDSKSIEALLWGAGSAICVHAVNLTAVIYFDQVYVIWYLHLAMAVSLANFYLNPLYTHSPNRPPKQ